MQSEPDEEGWVTIGKGGRKPGASKVEAAELLERRKKKKQKVEVARHDCLFSLFAGNQKSFARQASKFGRCRWGTGRPEETFWATGSENVNRKHNSELEI